MSPQATAIRDQFLFSRLGEGRGSNKSLLFIIANALAVAAIFLNSSWLYNRLGESDHYAYLGAAVYFPKSLTVLSHHPIIELVPTYALTAILYHLFSPELANLIKDYLFVALFLYMFLSFSLFLTQNFISAVLATIILAGYYYFLQSIGSDYTDSFIQIFAVAHLFFIKVFFDRKNTGKDTCKTLIILGVLSALMLSTGVLSVVYLANICVFFLALRLYNAGRGFYRNLFTDFSFWSAGFLGSILLISLYLYIFNSGYFMRLNVAKLFNYVQGRGQFHPLLEWLPYAGWLIFPSAILLFALLSCLLEKKLVAKYISSFFDLISLKADENLTIKKEGETTGFGGEVTFQAWSEFCFKIFIITISLSLIFIQFVVKQWSLQFMYFSQISFIYFLFLAIILDHNLRQNIGKAWVWFYIGATAVLVAYFLNLLSHREINYEMIATNFYSSSASLIPWGGLVAVFLILILAAYAKIISPIFLVLPVVILNLVSYSELYGLWCCIDSQKIEFLKAEGTTSEKYFDAHFRIAKFLDELDSNRTSDIWYDERERLGPVFKQVFSMNYFDMVDTSLINKNMPDLNHYPETFTSAGHEPIAGKNIVMISENLEKLSSAVEALRATKTEKINYEPFELDVGKSKIFIYQVNY